MEIDEKAVAMLEVIRLSIGYDNYSQVIAHLIGTFGDATGNNLLYAASERYFEELGE